LHAPGAQRFEFVVSSRLRLAVAVQEDFLPGDEVAPLARLRVLQVRQHDFEMQERLKSLLAMLDVAHKRQDAPVREYDDRGHHDDCQYVTTHNLCCDGPFHDAESPVVVELRREDATS
jgi:hypothetical protein